ncbi:MAG: hypothetical protein IT204_18750 [Fimbriimonadaceae bacterium]|nr:hypothetical protein [Fimbriimonadaceae bacterium]
MTRRGWLLVMLLAPALRAADTPHGYAPWQAGVVLRYQTRTSLQENALLPWSVSYLKSEPAAGGHLVTLRAAAARLTPRGNLQRDEVWLLDPRGLFAPGGSDGSWGPRYFLPPAAELQVADCVWQFEGRRALPFALHLLGLANGGDQPVATGGRYHVLRSAPLETAVGQLAGVLQVTCVERVAMRLLRPEPEPVLLRVRRFYAPGLGLVREWLEFLDFPRLGTLQTELVGYEGLPPVTAGAVAVAAAPPAGE